MQEFDLPYGTTVIGRSVECNLTIEDPLMSRQHARIVVDAAGGRVEDLGSRNGVRVNGVVVRGPTALSDGDRVRLGTQDLVFCRIEVGDAPQGRTTGVLRLCAKCRLPYPREILACPHCEATEQTEEDTLSGLEGRDGIAWSVQLLVEAIERALTLGRLADAERFVRHATSQLDDLDASGIAVDVEVFHALGVQAVSATLATNDPTWVLWVLGAYLSTSHVPPLELVERLAEAAPKHRAVLRTAFDDLLAHLLARVTVPSADELKALVRLGQIRGTLEGSGLTISSPSPNPS
ncbi:MAG: FHA domain-containing protein [Myxococcota bacterium]|nr:FHA domain-containing protein [Myxococcota bacterium]